MNSDDFIASVGKEYLGEAYGTSSGTNPTASTDYFNANYKAFSGGIEPSNPAADRSYDAGAIVGWADLSNAQVPPAKHGSGVTDFSKARSCGQLAEPASQMGETAQQIGIDHLFEDIFDIVAADFVARAGDEHGDEGKNEQKRVQPSPLGDGLRPWVDHAQ